jgi:hypothetical protein
MWISHHWKTFKEYRMYRSFCAWESHIRRRRILAANQQLGEMHILLLSPLRVATGNIRESCLLFKDTRMFRVRPTYVYTLAEFVAERKDQSAAFCEKLAEFVAEMVEEVATACAR